jgi:hypothetical protein
MMMATWRGVANGDGTIFGCGMAGADQTVMISFSFCASI